MAETKLKDCANVHCDRFLSVNSKHLLCPRCRNYDRRVADKPPSWSRNRYTNLCRWGSLLWHAAPKNTFKGFEPFDNEVNPQIRKRA